VTAGPTHAVAEPRDEPLIPGNPTLGTITDEIVRPLDRPPRSSYWLILGCAVVLLGLGVGLVAYTIATGIGVWGLNRTVGWAFDITNFVFWVGIGHAGTLISAILLLFRQRWRTSIARAAEAMTTFAVMCAALFPLIHMGRPWLAFLPRHQNLWVNQEGSGRFPSV
jgi:molybdopterin-containing oxidoreductase family membrane subunit